MSADVVLCASAMVPGYLAIASCIPVGSDCLRSAASFILTMRDDVQLSLSLTGHVDVRWYVDVTPAVRESCRRLLLREQQETLGRIARREADDDRADQRDDYARGADEEASQ